jgi:hypothetical protein
MHEGETIGAILQLIQWKSAEAGNPSERGKSPRLPITAQNTARDAQASIIAITRKAALFCAKEVRAHFDFYRTKNEAS